MGLALPRPSTLSVPPCSALAAMGVVMLTDDPWPYPDPSDPELIPFHKEDGRGGGRGRAGTAFALPSRFDGAGDALP